MKTKMLRFMMLIGMLFSVLTPATQAAAQTESASSKGISPAGMLNPDGTLNLNTGFNGSLDLSGFSVQMDPKRGPVFGPAQSGQNAPAASVPAGGWAGIGDGGGAIDGVVRAIVVKGTDIYIGGGFTDAANIPEADYIAKWNGASWSALGDNGNGDGSLTNEVYTLAFIGTELYVGGDFYQVYNHNTTAVSGANYIAKWNGTDWSALGSDGAGGGSLNQSVKTIAVSGTNVFAGGSFTNVNNNGTVLTAADYVAKWNTVSGNWSALGSNDGLGTDGSLQSGAYVAALAANGTDIYVGGQFTNVNNNGTVLTAADNIVKWNDTLGNWSALGSNDGLGGNGSISGTVFALATDGSGNLYVGGQFTNVNNNGTVLDAGDWIVKWNGTSWSALGHGPTATDASLNNYAYVLAWDGTDLYVGGQFTDVNNNSTVLSAADYIAKWDGTNWNALGSGASSNGALGSVVTAIAKNGSNVLVGGGFYDVNNGGAVIPQADFLAQWSGSNWSALSSDVNGALVNGYSGSQVYAIAVSGTNIYVGGNFTNISNHGTNIPEADYVAKWDGVNWSALGNDGAGDGALHYYVYALTVDGSGNLYVGGGFSNAANIPEADYIAKWNGSTWSALGNNGAGNGALTGGSYASVTTLVMDGTNLYVGGNFSNAANIPEADYIAKWDTAGGSWSALGNNGTGVGALNGYVAAVAVDGLGGVYVGGGFTDAAGISAADYIAKWNGSNWFSLGSNGASDGSLNAAVEAIAVNGLNVYAGGIFTNVRNGLTPLPTADLVAKWDGTNWSSLGSNGILGDGVFCVYCGASVRAIFLNGSDVYVGGSFYDINSNGVILSAADYITKWDGSSWSALGSNGTGDGSIKTNYGVYAITSMGTDLLVGGLFSNVNNNGTVVKEADYLAAYGMIVGGPDTTPPTVASIKRANPDPTSAASVDFTVKFSEPVYIPWAYDFTVNASGVVGAAVTSFSGSGDTYTVHVNTGGSSGTIRLDVTDSDIIVDAAGNYLGGTGAGNGNYTAGEVYTVNDAIPPTVQSIERVFPNPTNGAVADFRVTFSESVTGVDTAAPFNDFSLTVSGVTGAGINEVTGSGNVYIVRVNTGIGVGTIRLNVMDDNTIVDLASHPLGGAGVGDGNFTTGEVYNIDRAAPTVISSLRVNPSPTNLSSVDFAVLFSKSVTGVDASDFSLTTGVTGASISGISGSGNSYTVTVNTGSGNGNIRLDVLNDGTIVDALSIPLGTSFTNGESYSVIKSTTFADVPASYWANSYIERLYNAGITGGCSAIPLNYCPDSTVTRAQMAVFLLKAMHGPSYTPPAVGGDSGFTDVASYYWAAAWIKQLAAEGITGGCGAGVYCPDATVTRAQMAVFLLKAKHGSSYSPPAATGVFSDVPVGYWADKWIEQLAAEGVTSGCGAGIYCPDADVTRAQMAVFLVKAFNLP